MTTNSTGSSSGARFVHRLFAKNGVAERDRSKLLETILGLRYHAAYRRMNGALPFTIDELEQVAAHYGQSLVSIFHDESEENTKSATLAIGAFQAQCEIQLGEPASVIPIGTLIAAVEGVDSRWIVRPANKEEQAGTFFIEKLVLVPKPAPTPKRVAVLDDNPDVAELVSAYLQAVGFDAVPYFTFDSLLSVLSQRRFDAFIVDWLIGTATARDLLASIRAIDKECPIIVLTGKARSGDADVDDLASALASFHADLHEKPAQNRIIAASLAESLRLIDLKRSANVKEV